MYRLTEEEIGFICRDYSDGLSLREISRDYGWPRVRVKKILEDFGYTIRSSSQSKKSSHLSEEVFASLNEESAYWIGFLIADGCMTKRGDNSSCVTLSLSDVDIGHLRKFRFFLGCDLPIAMKPGKMASLCVHSTRLCSDLERNGVVPNKTFITTATDLLEKNVDFWRGVVDGDGNMYVDKRGYPVIQLAGSESLLKQFSSFIQSLGIKTVASVRKYPRKSTYVVYLAGFPAFQLINILYKEASVYLDRKFDIATSIIDQTDPRLRSYPDGKNLNRVRKLIEGDVKIIYTLKGKHSENEVGRMYNVNRKTINAIWNNRTWKHITKDL